MVSTCDPDAARELFKAEGKYPERMDIKPWRLHREGAGKELAILLRLASFCLICLKMGMYVCACITSDDVIVTL